MNEHDISNYVNRIDEDVKNKFDNSVASLGDIYPFKDNKYEAKTKFEVNRKTGKTKRAKINQEMDFVTRSQHLASLEKFMPKNKTAEEEIRDYPVSNSFLPVPKIKKNTNYSNRKFNHVSQGHINPPKKNFSVRPLVEANSKKHREDIKPLVLYPSKVTIDHNIYAKIPNKDLKPSKSSKPVHYVTVGAPSERPKTTKKTVRSKSKPYKSSKDQRKMLEQMENLYSRTVRFLDKNDNNLPSGIKLDQLVKESEQFNESLQVLNESSQSPKRKRVPKYMKRKAIKPKSHANKFRKAIHPEERRKIEEKLELLKIEVRQVFDHLKEHQSDEQIAVLMDKSRKLTNLMKTLSDRLNEQEREKQERLNRSKIVTVETQEEKDKRIAERMRQLTEEEEEISQETSMKGTFSSGFGRIQMDKSDSFVLGATEKITIRDEDELKVIKEERIHSPNSSFSRTNKEDRITYSPNSMLKKRVFTAYQEYTKKPSEFTLMSMKGKKKRRDSQESKGKKRRRSQSSSQKEEANSESQVEYSNKPSNTGFNGESNTQFQDNNRTAAKQAVSPEERYNSSAQSKSSWAPFSSQASNFRPTQIAESNPRSSLQSTLKEGMKAEVQKIIQYRDSLGSKNNNFTAVKEINLQSTADTVPPKKQPMESINASYITNQPEQSFMSNQKAASSTNFNPRQTLSYAAVLDPNYAATLSAKPDKSLFEVPKVELKKEEYNEDEEVRKMDPNLPRIRNYKQNAQDGRFSSYDVEMPLNYYVQLAKELEPSEKKDWCIRPHHLESNVNHPKSIPDDLLNVKYVSYYSEIPKEKEKSKQEQIEDMVSTIESKLFNLRQDFSYKVSKNRKVKQTWEEIQSKEDEIKSEYRIGTYFKEKERKEKMENLKKLRNDEIDYNEMYNQNPEIKHLNEVINTYDLLLKEIRSDEKEVLLKKRQEEFEKIRPPVDRWWELKSHAFTEEMNRNKKVINAGPDYYDKLRELQEEHLY